MKMKSRRGKERTIDLINLTPHNVTLIGKEGTVRIERYTGKVPRKSEQHVETSATIEGVPIIKIGLGALQDLPEPKKDTFYIVSKMTALYANRKDLLYGTDIVREPITGVIKGCRTLAQHCSTIKLKRLDMCDILRECDYERRI
jgi:hypothetical protein